MALPGENEVDGLLGVPSRRSFPLDSVFAALLLGELREVRMSTNGLGVSASATSNFAAGKNMKPVIALLADLLRAG